MKRETRRAFKDLAYFSSLGISVALAIFIGLGIGVWLDRKFDTSPWLTLIFLVFGIIAGFRNIALVIKRARNLQIYPAGRRKKRLEWIFKNAY